MHQPKTITSNGVTYRRISKERVVKRASSKGPRITEGPFYEIPGVNPQDWAVMPELGFLKGLIKENPLMHVIQMTKTPSSEHP